MSTTYARFLALHLPAFRLERCGYGADEVAALIAEERNAMRLVALTPAAREQGLARGMTVSQARSLVPTLPMELLEPDAEAHDRGEMLRAFERLSDQLQPLGPQDLVLEIARSTRAHGGELAVLEKAHSIAELLGHHLQAAISDDPIGALALARRSAGIVPAGHMAEALAPLPTADLASPQLVQTLRTLGIVDLGAFARLDPASVAGRYGPEGLRVHRIARGQRTPVAEGTLAWAPERLPIVRTPLAGATTSLQIQFVLPGILGQLAEALASKDLAVVQLRCGLHLERGNPVTFGVRVGRPTRDPRTLERLLRARLATVQVGAPVEELSLEVREAVPEQGWQPGLTDRSERGEPLPDVLARLLDALGPDAVFAAEPVDTWSPERAWQPTPFQLMPPVRHPLPPPDDPVALQERWEDGLRWARPTQLLERPEVIEVHLEGRVPTAVLLPRGWQRIERVEGPEELSGDWWNPQLAWQRSYWVAHLRDRRAWIFQAEELWYLHGWF